MLRCLYSCSCGAHHQNGEDDLFPEDGSSSGSRAFRVLPLTAPGCPHPRQEVSKTKSNCSGSLAHCHMARICSMSISVWV